MNGPAYPPGAEQGPPEEPDVPTYTLENIEYDVTVRIKGRLSDAAMDWLYAWARDYLDETSLPWPPSLGAIHQAMQDRAATAVPLDLYGTLEAAGFVESVEVVTEGESDGKSNV